MKIAGLILGILGGLGGLLGSLFAVSIGGLGAAFQAEGAQEVVGLGGAAFVFAIIGIVGGALAMAKPKIAGWLLIIAAIGGLIAVSMAWIMAFPLLLIGGIILIIYARNENKTQLVVQ